MNTSIVTVERPGVAFAAIERSSQQLPQFVHQSYAWYSRKNRQEAMTYVSALLFVVQQQLPKQELLYQQKVIEVIAKDMAEHTGALVARATGYTSPLYYQPEPIQPPQFQTPMFLYEKRWYQWTYTSIEQYGALIPPQALRAMALLQQAGITPERFWVGDLHEVRPRRSVDPVLCAQYGPWFIAIAEWI